MFVRPKVKKLILIVLCYLCCFSCSKKIKSIGEAQPSAVNEKVCRDNLSQNFSRETISGTLSFKMFSKKNKQSSDFSLQQNIKNIDFQINPQAKKAIFGLTKFGFKAFVALVDNEQMYVWRRDEKHIWSGSVQSGFAMIFPMSQAMGFEQWLSLVFYNNKNVDGDVAFDDLCYPKVIDVYRGNIKAYSLDGFLKLNQSYIARNILIYTDDLSHTEQRMSNVKKTQWSEALWQKYSQFIKKNI